MFGGILVVLAETTGGCAGLRPNPPAPSAVSRAPSTAATGGHVEERAEGVIEATPPAVGLAV
jgi:acyl-coenzyme A thioesterase PaaI-like protein